jgi:hypothetical protein
MLIAKESDEILGFTVLGFEASELMASVQTAMVGHLPYTVLRDAELCAPHDERRIESVIGQRAGALKSTPRSKHMSSASIGIVHARAAIERVATIEDVGKEIVRWGLVVVLAWIGAMNL